MTFHNKVSERADDAAKWEAYVAGKIARGGIQVLQQPFTLATSRAELKAYAKTVDLIVAGFPVEVKSKGVEFGDEPSEYPYEDILICASSAYKNKYGADGQHGDFIHVSTRTGALLWLPAGSACGERRVYDSRRKEAYYAKYAAKEKLRTFAEFLSAYRSRQDGGHFQWQDTTGGG